MSSSDGPDRENGLKLLPKFDNNGLITAMVVRAADREPLMLAHMNEAALNKTQETGLAHFYSRSRGELWLKGESSGNTLTVEEIRIDCDQDALWIAVTVNGHGAACHTGRVSCFFRRVSAGDDLEMMDDNPRFNPEDVYGD